MSWYYSLAKETVDDDVVFSLIEVYTNEDGGIWGHTGHTDILGYIEGEDDTEEEVAASILNTLHLVSKDVLNLLNL